MIRSLLVLFLLVQLILPARSQTRKSPGEPELTALLNFKGGQAGSFPAGWRGGPHETIVLDDGVKNSGERSARIERTTTTPPGFTTLTNSFPVDFAGKRIELRGFLKTEDVTGFAALWLREDGDVERIEFDDMRGRRIQGSNEWTKYSILLPLNPTARNLVFGAIVSGTGKVWVADLELLVDGQPVWAAPKVEIVPTALERDHEFDAGSKIVLPALTPELIDNLARLGKVWGFLKYHHPKITAGELHWDYELFRILPAIIAARNRTEANDVLLRWIRGLGDVKPQFHFEHAVADLYLRPDLAWIEDEASLGQSLSECLRAVDAARPTDSKQFYVALAPVGNPMFTNEPDYSRIKIPDAGFQLLGLFRFWNIIRYWAPYRDLVDGDWDARLIEFTERIARAETADAYALEMMALFAKIQDTHANLWNALRVRPPIGDSQLPARIRFIENQAVITEIIEVPGEKKSDLRRGDVIRAIDGVPVEELVGKWSPYYAASNQPTRLRDIARTLTQGPAGPVKIKVLRENETLSLDENRILLAVLAAKVPLAALGVNGGILTHDLPGPAFRLLSKDVAYLKFSAVKESLLVDWLQQAAGTKGWILDLRNYPSEFMVFALGSRLVSQPTAFTRFTNGDLNNPGAFAFGEALKLSPKKPGYPGQIVILVDEVTQSSAEYTTMAFRASPRTVVIGSTTAGADGNVSSIRLPGGLSSMISGIGVYYPDRRPTQRVGIVPDIEVKPTIAGIRAGRDELLEAALKKILGPEIAAEDLMRMTHP